MQCYERGIAKIIQDIEENTMGKEKYDKTISIRLSSGMLEKLDKKADESGIDRTELIRFAIAEIVVEGNQNFLDRNNRLTRLEKIIENEIARNNALQEKLAEIENALFPKSKPVPPQEDKLGIVYTGQDTPINLNEAATDAINQTSSKEST